MLVGCHSLVFGALPGAGALQEIAHAGFACAVLAQIHGQAEHAASVGRQRSWVPPLPLVAIDAATHEIDPGLAAIAHAARLRVSPVIVAPGGRPSGRPRTRILAEAATDAAVTLAVTPRAGSAVWNVETALRLLERAPGLRVWPDTSHLARAGDDLVEAVRRLAPHSGGWFIRDHAGRGSGPGSFESQVPGRGALDLAAVIAALRRSRFGGPVVFQAVGHLPRGRPSEALPLDRLRELAGEARAYLESELER